MLPTNIKTFATVYIKLEGGGAEGAKVDHKKRKELGKGSKKDKYRLYGLRKSRIIAESKMTERRAGTENST